MRIQTGSMMALTLAASAAGAAPLVIPHTGMLLDASDVPVAGPMVHVQFGIHAAATGGSPLWMSQTCTVPVRAGRFATTLGDTCPGAAPLDESVVPPGTPRWIELTVEGVTLLPRLQVSSVPSASVALRSLDTEALRSKLSSSGALNATDNPVDWTQLKNVPADVAAGGNYSVGGGLQLVGKQFSVASGGIGTAQLADAAVTSAKIADAAILSAKLATGVVGTVHLADGSVTGTKIAAGAITGAHVANGSLGIEKISGGIPLSATTGSLDASRLTGTLPAGMVAAASSVATEGAPSSTSCSTGGILRWDTSTQSLRVCDGTSWKYVMTNGSLGTSAALAGRTCKALKAAGVTTSGVYWIDPNQGSIDDAYRVFCDMDTDGGGWTVCLRFDFNTTVSARRFDGSTFNGAFGTPAAAPAAYATNCNAALTALGNTSSFDFGVRTHVIEADQWQWVGPVSVSAWRAVYDNTTCSSPTDGQGSAITECKGSSSGGLVNVASNNFRIGYHNATGGSCDNGSNVNQFAQGNNNNVLLELDHGYNYGHGTYMHFDCIGAASHPCNPAGSGSTNSSGTGAGRLLVGQSGANGPTCGPYHKDLTLTRPTVSFMFRER